MLFLGPMATRVLRDFLEIFLGTWPVGRLAFMCAFYAWTRYEGISNRSRGRVWRNLGGLVPGVLLSFTDRWFPTPCSLYCLSPPPTADSTDISALGGPLFHTVCRALISPPPTAVLDLATAALWATLSPAGGIL